MFQAQHTRQQPEWSTATEEGEAGWHHRGDFDEGGRFVGQDAFAERDEEEPERWDNVRAHVRVFHTALYKVVVLLCRTYIHRTAGVPGSKTSTTSSSNSARPA